MTLSTQRIRPAARLIKTIGQDLIKDAYSAIVELVKNSYDADSPAVDIRFSYSEESQRLIVRVSDTGHGMDLDTVVNKWLVPATDDKFKRQKSTKKRVLQGRKGIGRFAASILGERLLLESTKDGTTTSLILDMDELSNIEYLDQFELEVSSEHTGKSPGTILEIEKDNVTPEEVQNIWTKKQIGKLLLELRSLLSPNEVYEAAKAQGYLVNYDEFSIKLEFNNFPVDSYENVRIDVEPFPIVDLFDYRISGVVGTDGTASLEYFNQNIPSLPSEKISIKIPLDLHSSDSMKYPGEIFVDLRVFDRDPDSIDALIKRGLKDPSTGEYVGKNDARNILNDSYGVGIYREQFRIRPYGAQDFDWLSLDKDRIQKSNLVGHNQIIGFVYVRPEEESGLEEKSARDGLVENANYFGLLQVIKVALNELGSRRYSYREKSQKGSRNKSIDQTINDLFDFGAITQGVNKRLENTGISQKDLKVVESIVSEVVETEKRSKSTAAKKIKDTIAIYQGQATLGKITHVLLHEGRKHIKYISETTPRVIKWSQSANLVNDHDLQDKLKSRGESLLTHSKGLSYLFKKIEPLARTRRSPAKTINLLSAINNSFEIFSHELNHEKISFYVKSSDNTIEIIANEVDLITVFSNLIENSIYWLGHSSENDLKITVDIAKENGDVVIDYRDNGPGFQGSNLELMFDPGYSMKPDGSGLGLALAGEAVTRVGGSVKALESDKGAYFAITLKEI